jgi:hypothetical protein
VSIARALDAHDRIENFEAAHVGPGVYVLFDGRVCDSNIVYVGKSCADVVMRVTTHLRDKTFDRVGLILPRRTDPDFVHNLEHHVIEEFVQRYGDLPEFNIQRPRRLDWLRRFDWHHVARRRADARFW